MIDPELRTVLHDMHTEMTNNHIDVVQRLAVLETRESTLAELNTRVSSLESFKSKITGVLIFIGATFGAVLSYFGVKHNG